MHGKKSEFNSELFKKVDQPQIFQAEVKMTVMSFDFFAKNRIEGKKKAPTIVGAQVRIKKIHNQHKHERPVGESRKRAHRTLLLPFRFYIV